MNDIEISNKGDEEILSLIRSYQSQGYQVWLQKRCSDKFLMSTDFNAQGVLDIDNSAIFKSNNIDLKQFNEPSSSVICSVRKNEDDGHKASTMEMKETMFMFPRKTQTDLYSLLSPKLNSERDEAVKSYYDQLKEGLHLESFGQVKEAVTVLQNLVNELENQLIDSQILHLIFVESLLTLGILYAQIGKHSDGKICLEKCLRLFVIKDQILLALIYLKLGQYSHLTFSYQKSIEYFNQALIIYEIYHLKPEIAYCMMSIAVIYSKVNEYELAQSIGLHAFQLVGNQQSKYTGQMYQMFGELHYYNENYTEALTYFDTAYDIKLQSSDSLSRIRTINFIASSCFHLEEYEKAQQLFTNALSLLEEQNSLAEAQLLQNLAITKQMQKINSRKEYEKSLNIFLQYYPENHPSVNRLLRNRND